MIPKIHFLFWLIKLIGNLWIIHFLDCTIKDIGRPAKAVRLMVGLLYLKAMYGESDESVVMKWVENPYWQYFCGETEFQHEFPIEPTSMVKWRRRAEKNGLGDLLTQTIATGLKVKAVDKKDFARVNVDTTVMEKAIAYPTDARLMYKMLLRLLKMAHERKVELRQSYARKAKKSFIMQHRYRHARQSKRANREEFTNISWESNAGHWPQGVEG